MTDRAADDEGFGDLFHFDRRLHPYLEPFVLARLLHRDAVDHRREHPHVVAGGAFDDAVLGRRHAADDVSPADDEADFDVVFRQRPDLRCNEFQNLCVNPMTRLAGQRFT